VNLILGIEESRTVEAKPAARRAPLGAPKRLARMERAISFHFFCLFFTLWIVYLFMLSGFVLCIDLTDFVAPVKPGAVAANKNQKKVVTFRYVRDRLVVLSFYNLPFLTLQN
jgi:hypothetical protein